MVWKLLTWLGPRRTSWAHECAFDLARAWRESPDAAMQFTLAASARVDWRSILLAACDCADAVLAPLSIDDPSPREAVDSTRAFAEGTGTRGRCEYLEIVNREAMQERRREGDHGPRHHAFEIGKNIADAARRVSEHPWSQDAVAIASACAGDTFQFSEIVRARIGEREFLGGAAPHGNVWSLLRECRLVDEGIEWALPLGDNLQRAWRECPRGDWMIQMAEAFGVDDALVVHATADCVREALAQFHPNRDDGEAVRYVETVRRHAEDALRMAADYTRNARSVAPERVAEDAGNSHRGMASAASALIAGMAQRATTYARQEPLTRGPSRCVVAVRDATWELGSSGAPNAPALMAQRTRERIPASALVR